MKSLAIVDQGDSKKRIKKVIMLFAREPHLCGVLQLVVPVRHQYVTVHSRMPREVLIHETILS